MIFMLFLISAWAFPQVITVTLPSGGESWEIGSTQNITWTSAYLSSSSVVIKLYKDGVYSSSIITGTGTYNSGSYSWTIPSTLSASNVYKIKIEEYNNSSVYDESDTAFALTEAIILLGDYNHNNELDGSDIGLLLNYWNDNKTSENADNNDSSSSSSSESDSESSSPSCSPSPSES